MKAFLFLTLFISISSSFAFDTYHCDYLEGIKEYYINIEIDEEDDESKAYFSVHQYSGAVRFEERHGDSYSFYAYLGREFKKTRVSFNKKTLTASVRTNIGNSFEIYRSAKYGCEKTN